MTPLDPGLLTAVIDNPDDDNLRLVCADWWEENGEEDRAEFVRVQVELAGLVEKRVVPLLTSAKDKAVILNSVLEWQREGLRRRERDLFCGEWDREISVFSGTNNHAPFYRRGFIEEVAPTADNWLAHADTMTAAAPIRKVSLTTPPRVLRTRTGKHHLGRHRASLDTRPRKWIDCDWALHNSVTALILLMDRWPRIEFVLPES